MALSRPLFVGFSSASKAAREGGDLEGTVQTARGPRTFTLPWFFVRDVDALLERWRREEHEAVVLTLNDGVLGRTLIEAAGVGGLQDVSFLLGRGVDVNYERGDYSALMNAAENGHLAVVAVLLDAGAERQAEALEGAASEGQTPAVALLLDRGVNVHDNHDAAVRAAARGGFLETMQFLVERGADFQSIDVDDFTALELAVASGHLAVATVLLDLGAGRLIYALWDAAEGGHLPIAALLLDRGADVNEIGPTGQPALAAAARDGHLEIARLLLDRGAEVNALNGLALRVARRGAHEAVVALLLERGAVEPGEHP